MWLAGQRSPHGLDEQRCEVIGLGPAFDVRFCQNDAVLRDHDALVVCLVVRRRLRQCPKVGFPGFVLLFKPLEVNWRISQLPNERFLRSLCHDHFLLDRVFALGFFATKPDSSPRWMAITPRSSSSSNA